MIEPKNVAFMAKKKEEENLKFRTFLKCNGDEDVLDQQFQRLHKELFAKYDCNQCRNCCKQYKGFIPKEDIQKDADFLGLSVQQFKERYLDTNEDIDGYDTKHKPCDFLLENGECQLRECKPDNCIKYPYTDQPGRLWSLYSVLDAVSVCPVAFEILERLKKEYHFR